MNDAPKAHAHPPIKVTATDLELVFPEPQEPLLQGPGEPCTWETFMCETAVQTHCWFKHHGPNLSPPPFEERFTLDDQ